MYFKFGSEKGRELARSISSEFQLSFKICKFVSIHRADGELLFREIARKTSRKCICNPAVESRS